ncbi:hypothetical protein OSH11_19535 [Kaistia dalseonensis]|uniref:Tetratricopeptide (TPR) repeat protein n=1 Tax=Kaistia dalseonensis TaxID=410840 RepID=A0ABU0HB41_9HYPH|nr:hypothetical protein [Kaistia dalseonensis]MCX5496906.1 hypothetical protein [Kaistia dalseonensis]MDQ0439531.1 tetratricopeptide (TPR) repeat protein [Kaistia dalseonensis]
MPVRRAFIGLGSIAIVALTSAAALRIGYGPSGDMGLTAQASERTLAGASADLISLGGQDVSARQWPPVDTIQMAQATAVPPVQMPPPAAAPLPPAAPLVTETQPANGTPASSPAPPVTEVSPTPGTATDPNAVDETALRYFARQGDTRRLNAEIGRLRALYPDWYPPDNLTQPKPIADPLLDQMWKYYSDGQYAAARGAIADRLAHDPQWKPPADLLARLDIGEARERLVNASNAQQWDTVVSIAAATPSLLTCADVDVLWRLSEAFAKSDRSSRARDVGTYVLSNCVDPKERLATVQKAMTYLKDGELDDLLKLERVGADGQGEFAPVKGDLARKRVGAAAADPKQKATPADLALLAQIAQNATVADDAVLLGGYWFAHGDPAQAAKWYELAKTRADTPEIARGYAYALNQLKRPADGEAAAYQWRDDSPENKQAYLVVATALLSLDPPAKIEPDVLARMAKAISEARFPQGAQELGWYAYNIGQTLTAARWFTAALTWDPNNEPSAFGLALAYNRLGNKAAFQKVVKVWGPRSERIARLADPRAAAQGRRSSADDLPLPPSIENPGQPVRQAASTGQDTLVPSIDPISSEIGPGEAAVAVDPVPASARVVRTSATRGSNGGGGGACNGSQPAGQLSASAALARGWCMLNLNRSIEAVDAFETALQKGDAKMRQDAAYGKTLANLQAGLTDAAAVSAAAASQPAARSTEMRVAILSQRAIAAYNDNRFVETLMYLNELSQLAPEQNDRLMMRGWSYFHLRRFQEAKQIFVAVAGTGSHEAAKALAALAETTKPR